MKNLLSKTLVEQLHLEIKRKSAELIDNDIEPHLAVIMVGDDEASAKYVEIKSKRAKEDGIILSLYHMEEEEGLDAVLATIKFLADDPEIHGIIVQLPLPESFSETDVQTIIDAIPDQKDVDGMRGTWETLNLTNYSDESLKSPGAYFLPPPVLAVQSLMNYYDIDIADKEVVCIGQGRLIGKPLHAFYKKLGITASAVDETSINIFDTTKKADIVICGTGQKELITYQWVKEGAVVIDCANDTHEDSISQVASAYAPPKGGVGPLTVAWLLYNTIQSASKI